MNIFGIFLLVIVARVIFSKKGRKEKYIYFLSILVFLELFVNVGYFVKLGNYEILYSEFLLIILILYSVLFLFSKKINKKLFFVGLIFLCCILLTETLLLINPLSEPILRNNDYIIPEFSIYSLITSTRFLFFIIIALSSKSIFESFDLHEVINIIKKYGSHIIFLFYIEWILNNIFKTDLFRRVVIFVFGTGAHTVEVLLTRGNLHSIQGFTREPAYLSQGLFYYLLIVILSETRIEKINKIIFVTVPLILLSGSFSGILYTIAIFVIYLLKNRITSIYTISLIIIVLLLIPFIINSDLFQYYYFRLLNSLNIFKDSQAINTYTSEGVRLNTIIHTFKAFTKRPLLGLGVGIPYSYGFLSVLFASIGSIGGILWYIFVFNVYGELKNNIKSVLVITTLSVVWNFTGNMSISYSVYILIIALLIGKSFAKNTINKRVNIIAR